MTIVTACLQIANRVVAELSLSSDVRLILTGGIVRPQELSMIGQFPQDAFKQLHVDKAFIGIGGIDPVEGLTEYNLEDSQTKQALIRSAREKIIVADGSKLGVTTFSSVAPIQAINTIVTDRTAPEAIVQAIREAGTQVVIAN